MNPEDRIRQLMEENAMLRAQLAQSNPYAAEASRPLYRPPGPDDYELSDLDAEYERGMASEAPAPYIQKMPYKPSQDGGPYLKKMPNKNKTGNSPYLRKL